MDRKDAIRILNRVKKVELSNGCVVPLKKISSVWASTGKVVSLARLVFDAYGFPGVFPRRGEVFRVCGTSKCLNPEHLVFDEMERFWLYAKRDQQSGCLIWQHSVDGGGYGVFFSQKYGRDKAHRISYAETYGDFDSSLFVLHKCDNPSCIDPTHLFLGTNMDNIKDKVNKRRQHHPIGNLNGRCILSDEDVQSMRDDYKSGKYSYRTLHKKYNISQTQVSRIIRKESRTCD